MKAKLPFDAVPLAAHSLANRRTTLFLTTHDSINRRIRLSLLSTVVVKIVDLVVLQIITQYAHDAPILAAIDVDLDRREAFARREDVLDERRPCLRDVQAPDFAGVIGLRPALREGG